MSGRELDERKAVINHLLADTRPLHPVDVLLSKPRVPGRNPPFNGAFRYSDGCGEFALGEESGHL